MQQLEESEEAYNFVAARKLKSKSESGSSGSGDSLSIGIGLAGSHGKGKGKGGDSKSSKKSKGRDSSSDNVFDSGKGKGSKKGGESGDVGKGKGKGWAVNHLAEEEYDEGISLGCLMRGTPLNAITADAQPEVWNGYELVEALIDSGAGECVCGPQHFGGFDMKVDPGRAGANAEYVCADGGRIPNLGEKAISGLSEEGLKLAINFQVTAVDRPLVAVSKLTAAGHQVWFGKELGTITHSRTGKVTTFKERNGVYVLDMCVRRPVSGDSRR